MAGASLNFGPALDGQSELPRIDWGDSLLSIRESFTAHRQALLTPRFFGAFSPDHLGDVRGGQFHAQMAGPHFGAGFCRHDAADNPRSWTFDAALFGGGLFNQMARSLAPA